jgi:hypothetical protein
MSTPINHTEEETELVFGSRTIFVPGRTVEIGYSVRKKSPYPLVEELVLKLLNVVGSAPLSNIAGFVDLPAKDLKVAFQPLLSSGLMIQSGDDFQLTDVGKMLFKRSDNDTPSLTESESRVQQFIIDDVCALPATAPDFSAHRVMSKGNLRRLIDDLRREPTPGDDLIGRIRQNFGEYFAHFMRNKGDLEKMREEQLELHKTEYAKTKKSFAIQADIYGVIQRNGTVVNRVLPFDVISVKTEGRMTMRSTLIEAAKTRPELGGMDEIGFLRDHFGKDFLDDKSILSAIEQFGSLQWFKVIRQFYSESHPKLHSGDQRTIGEVCVPKNLQLIKYALERVLSEKEFSSASPLRIAWLRPGVESWGRSISFLDGIRTIRESFEDIRKGSVVFELWENRHEQGPDRKPHLRFYWPWFDDIRVFRSSAVPPKMEMLFVGDSDGIAVTHAFTPLKACFPCPIGVFFESSEMIRKLVAEEIEPNLRSLPKLDGKAKITARTTAMK